MAFETMQAAALTKGVPIEALQIFMDNMMPVKDSLYSVIRKTCSSTYVYGNNEDKQATLFNTVSCFIDSLISSFERTSQSINGELNRAMSRTGHYMSCQHCRGDCEYKRVEDLDGILGRTD